MRILFKPATNNRIYICAWSSTKNNKVSASTNLIISEHCHVWYQSISMHTHTQTYIYIYIYIYIERERAIRRKFEPG